MSVYSARHSTNVGRAQASLGPHPKFVTEIEMHAHRLPARRSVGLLSAGLMVATLAVGGCGPRIWSDNDGMAVLGSAPVVEAAPAPEPEPESTPTDVAPAEGPAPAPVMTAEVAKIQKQRKAGIGVMAAGGVIALAGFGVTLAFTVLGDKEQRAEIPDYDVVDKHDANAKIGGVLLATGLGIIGIGGIVFVNAKKKKARYDERMETVRLAPTPQGVVLSGRF